MPTLMMMPPLMHMPPLLMRINRLNPENEIEMIPQMGIYPPFNHMNLFYRPLPLFIPN
jgi:hypothetical protein